MGLQEFLDLLKVMKNISDRIDNKVPNPDQVELLHARLEKMFKGFKASGLETVALDQKVEQEGADMAKATVGIGNVRALKGIGDTLSSAEPDPVIRLQNIKHALDTMITLVMKLQSHRRIQMNQAYVQDLQNKVKNFHLYAKFLESQANQWKVSTAVVSLAKRLKRIVEMHIAGKVKLQNLRNKVTNQDKPLSSEDQVRLQKELDDLEDKHNKVFNILELLVGQDQQGMNFFANLMNNPKEMLEFFEEGSETECRITHELCNILNDSNGGQLTEDVQELFEEFQSKYTEYCQALDEFELRVENLVNPNTFLNTLKQDKMDDDFGDLITTLVGNIDNENSPEYDPGSSPNTRLR